MANGSKKNWWNWLISSLPFLPAVTVSFIVPLVLAIYGGWHGGRFSYWAVALIALGLGVIVFRIVHVFIYDGDEFQDLFAECKFMLIHANSAWSFGGGLACTLTGVYFFFSSNGNLFERYAGAISIYIAVIGGTLAIHAFYRHTAPITDMDVLLRWLIEDMKNVSEESRLWIIFPALNLGYYRNRFDLGAKLPERHICNDFKKALQVCAQKLGPKATAITFPTNLYEPLFSIYDQMVRNPETENKNKKSDNTTNLKNTASPKSAECIRDTVTEAEACLARFRGNSVENFGRCFAILPREFPQHMVIIGDAVYSIMTYGMPIYKVDAPDLDDPAKGVFRGKFHAIIGEHKPVRLLVYRRTDVALADDVCKHLERLVADGGISLPVTPLNGSSRLNN